MSRDHASAEERLWPEHLRFRPGYPRNVTARSLHIFGSAQREAPLASPWAQCGCRRHTADPVTHREALECATSTPTNRDRRPDPPKDGKRQLPRGSETPTKVDTAFAVLIL